MNLKMHIGTEGNKAYEEKFRKDVTQIYEGLQSCDNPFIENGEELGNINSKCIMSPARSPSVRNVLNIGLQVYDIFCEKKLFSAKHSIYKTISQNKLSLLCQTNTLSTPKCKLKLLSLKFDVNCILQAKLNKQIWTSFCQYPVSLSE